MRDIIGAWLIASGLFTLVYVTAAELAHRDAARRKRADDARKLATLIVPYDQGCSPHPWPSERVVWVSTDNAAEAWAAIGGSAA